MIIIASAYRKAWNTPRDLSDYQLLEEYSSLELAFSGFIVIILPTIYLIGMVMLCRILTLGNVMKDYSGHWLTLHSEILQNTYKQNFLFTINLICILAFEEIAIEKMTFVVGIDLFARIFFYIGYLADAYFNTKIFIGLGLLLTYINDAVLIGCNIKYFFIKA